MLIYKLLKFSFTKKKISEKVLYLLYSSFYLLNKTGQKKSKDINSKDDVYPLF